MRLLQFFITIFLFFGSNVFSIDNLPVFDQNSDEVSSVLEQYRSGYVIEDMPLVNDTLPLLSTTGSLKEFWDVAVYLKLPSSYFDLVVPAIKSTLQQQNPDVHFDKDYRANMIGAFIPVFNKKEIEALAIMGYNSKDIVKLGNAYNFSIIELRSKLEFSFYGLLRKNFMLIVESDDLDTLRASYGLPKIAFEIPIATEKMFYIALPTISEQPDRSFPYD